jgi:hypothetical protein
MENEEEFEVDQILEERGGSKAKEYLVSWCVTCSRYVLSGRRYTCDMRPGDAILIMVPLTVRSPDLALALLSLYSLRHRCVPSYRRSCFVAQEKLWTRAQPVALG